VVFADIDKDAVGAQPRALDQGDQALAALVGPQIAHRAAALVWTPLVDCTVETAAYVAFVEWEPLNRGGPGVGERGIVQGSARFAN
jgi:hypothetical protein